MASKRLSRRTFLRGAGGIGVALPFLNIMRARTVAASHNEFPGRFVAFFTPNGTVPGHWEPTASAEFGEILAPLTPHQADVIQISGLGMLSGGGDRKGHNRGVGCFLTGRPTLPGNEDGNDGALSYASGISLDQYLAQKVGQQT